MNKRKDKDRICILHLIQGRYLRGAELFASRLSSSLAVRGFKNVLCSLHESGSDSFPVSDSVTSLSLKAKQIGIFDKFGLQPVVLLKLINVFRRLGPDIVLAHGSESLKYAALASRFYSTPVTIYKNIGIASFWVRNPLKAWVNKKLVQWIDAVVSVSQVSREDFCKLYGLCPSKVTMIPNAVDLREYQNLKIGRERLRTRRQLKLTEKDAVLISVGSLSPEKNHGELLTLMKELREMSPHLLLVGDGPLRHALELEAKKLELQDCVHFLGLQPNVIPFLAASDIFLLPSLSEGMPGVLIEAGMVGIPSVAYDVGGVKEVIEPNLTGILVPPHYYEEFKSTVVSLLKDSKKRERLGSSSRRRYPTRFAMQKVAGEYEVLLLKLLHDKRKEE